MIYDKRVKIHPKHPTEHNLNFRHLVYTDSLMVVTNQKQKFLLSN